MSTAGKVLVVLVSLLTLVWIVLIATVAQLNKNGTKAVRDLETQVAKLEQDVAANQKSLESLKDQISREQTTTGQELAVIQSRQTELERARTELLETASRVKYQVAEIEAAVKTAQLDRDQRVAEKKAETEARDAARAEVAQLKIEHSRLSDQLTQLRNKFKATVEENRRLVDRLLRGGNPPARRASFAR